MTTPTTHQPAAGATTPAINIDSLHVTLGGNEILRDITLALPSAQLTGIIGPNGAGKSTLLRAITGFVPAQSGTIQLHGQPLHDLTARQVAQQLAVVQQLPVAPDSMRVRELVTLGRHPHIGLLGRESNRDAKIVDDAMQRAGCDILADRYLNTLSGGERRRAFIARALAQEPTTLLLDEPTANLDVDAQSEIFTLLGELAASGVTVCVVVHDLTLAAAYCDRLVLFHEGRLVIDGPPHEVLRQDRVRAVYGPHVTVFPHPETGRPLVIPAGPTHV